MQSNWFSIVSLVLNVIFGGSFLVTAHTLRSTRKKAGAEALGAEANTESKELDNVEKAIKIWREMAEGMKTELSNQKAEHEYILSLVNKLQKSVDRLNCTNAKILRLLDKISHDNMERTVAEIKEEIQKNES